MSRDLVGTTTIESGALETGRKTFGISLLGVLQLEIGAHPVSRPPKSRQQSRDIVATTSV